MVDNILKIIWENHISSLTDSIPITIAIPLTALIIICRKEIRGFMSRFSADTDNSDRREGNTHSEGQYSSDTKSNPKNVDEELYFDPDLQPILAEQEQNIWTDIKKRHHEKYPEHRNHPLVKFLVKELVMVQTRAHFELLYGAIYGSQIRLLRRINERGSSVPYNEIYAYYQEVQKEFSQKEFSDFFGGHKTEDYLAFLLDNSLIIRQGESCNITVRGVEFLTWMSKARKGEDKFW